MTRKSNSVPTSWAIMRSMEVGAFVVVLFAIAIPAQAIELITNGDFETGNFAGWTVDNQAGGSGSWFISAPGFVTPLSFIPTALNPGGGLFYAVTDQTGPGAHALRQTFTVPINAVSVTLSYEMFVNDSDGGPLVNPSGLDYTAVPNQHSRVDILTAAAAPFSTAPIDIVASYYLGVDPQAGNPNPYTPYVFDISGVVAPGGTYQLRFGEVDNQGFFNHGVDNVSIAAAVPEPTAVILASAAMLPLALRRRKPS